MKHRPLEFRAWDGEKMHYNAWVNDMGECLVWDKENDVELWIGDYIPANNTHVPMVSVMQFTGEVDSNGNKIFEGDICECILMLADDEFPETESTPLEINTVSFGGGSFILGYGITVYEQIKVIGNIYENPTAKTAGKRT